MIIDIATGKSSRIIFLSSESFLTSLKPSTNVSVCETVDKIFYRHHNPIIPLRKKRMI